MNQLIVINSDDFGYSSRINSAILQAFKERLCSSTTIMANMPGFEEAVQLAHEYNLVDSVGIHIVLSEGRPLTEPIKGCPRFCNDRGEFQRLLGKRYWNLTYKERDAVKIEMFKQIERCRDYGLRLTHLDSHHHVHHSWGLLDVCLDVVRENDIPFVRPRFFRPGVPWYRGVTTLLYNARLKHKNLTGTDYVLDVQSYLRLQDQLKSPESSFTFEIMVHPAFDEDGLLWDAMDQKPLSTWMAQIKHYQSAVSYARIVALQNSG